MCVCVCAENKIEFPDPAQPPFCRTLFAWSYLPAAWRRSPNISPAHGAWKEEWRLVTSLGRTNECGIVCSEIVSLAKMTVSKRLPGTDMLTSLFLSRHRNRDTELLHFCWTLASDPERERGQRDLSFLSELQCKKLSIVSWGGNIYRRRNTLPPNLCWNFASMRRSFWEGQVMWKKGRKFLGCTVRNCWCISKKEGALLKVYGPFFQIFSWIKNYRVQSDRKYYITIYCSVN